ncbi:MAG: carbonic anhydrase [Lacipirellulaceae bacterium]
MVAAALVAKGSTFSLEQVRDAFEQSVRAPEVLIIAHSDEVAVNAIVSVFEGLPAVVVKVPQSEWGLDSDSYRRVLEFAVLEKGVSRLVLVGHSQGYTEDRVQSWQVEQGDSSRVINASRESGSPVLEGAKRAQKTLQESKQHFVNQIDGLYRHEQIGKALEEKTLELYGFFYLAQSGAFMAYDSDSSTLRPLA